MATRFKTVQGGRGQSNNQDTYFDYSLLFTVLFLIGFGLMMIYSSSSYRANLDYNDSAYFLKKQLTAALLGIVCMVVVSYIPYHFWEKLAVPAYVISIGLIPLVLTPLGYSSHGARRWIRIVGFSLQPAEVAKLSMVIFLACLVCKMGKRIRTMKGFFVLMIPPGIVAVMVWKITQNMSSAIIILGIAVLMIFVASPDYKRFIIMALVVVGGAALVVFVIVKMASSPEMMEKLEFRGLRILAWLNPEAYADDKGFQTLQALYAIGSGGIFGKGLGESVQKLGFLPEAQNDMIFSIICEELGLFGAVAVILLFLLLIWRCMIIANNAPDLFGALLVVGVMGHLAIQVILNIAVCTSVIPNTGISLPFISYGGSSVMFLLIEIGIVLNVGRSIRLKDL
ncbi:MAG: cell division protein FtsW [Lachnospiraceae bacterium]|jgi:cell division protein FtsW|nr:cell division protein FtsW [Lachnospiraceae bacterium]